MFVDSLSAAWRRRSTAPYQIVGPSASSDYLHDLGVNRLGFGIGREFEPRGFRLN